MRVAGPAQPVLGEWYERTARYIPAFHNHLNTVSGALEIYVIRNLIDPDMTICTGPSGDSPEQHEAEPAEAPFLQRLFNHHATGAGSAGKRRPDEEVGYRANASNYGTLQHESRPGLPKVSRECLVSEIRCYGSYIMPVLLVFGVLVLVVSLSLYWRSQR